MAATKTITATTTEAEAARLIPPGSATWLRAVGTYAIYLRNLKSGRGWAVAAGWVTDEAFDDDYNSISAIAGLEGKPHGRVDYLFGADFAAARDYYLHCCERITRGDVPDTLSLPPVC